MMERIITSQDQEIERLKTHLDQMKALRDDFEREHDRLRAWLGALANLRRIVGFVNDDLVEELARKALRGEQLPHNLKLYAAPDRR